MPWPALLALLTFSRGVLDPDVYDPRFSERFGRLWMLSSWQPMAPDDRKLNHLVEAVCY